MDIEYGKEFGVLPQDVSEVVTVREWQRWLLWKKVQNSREANETFGTGSMTPEQKKLMRWSMTDGEY